MTSFHELHQDNQIEALLPPDAAREGFWQEELERLPERNRLLSEQHLTQLPEISERQRQALNIVTTCMDERNFGVEEALGLLPGEAEVYASGGGMISFEKFAELYGDAVAEAREAGKEIHVYLTPHECSEGEGLGCAAFKYDRAKQKSDFSALKQLIEHDERFANVKVHVQAFDTSGKTLRDLETGDELQFRAPRPQEGVAPHENPNHAGYTVYVGDAYRAWTPNSNQSFRLSALNPNVKNNAEIALSVMEHHSKVDLSDKPIVLHVDYPDYGEDPRTEAARANIDTELEAFLSNESVKSKKNSGALKIVKTRTNMQTWRGKLLDEAS